MDANPVIVSEFESATLLAEFENLGLQAEASKEVDKGCGPPSKRRKLDDETRVMDVLIAEVYESLGRQKATSLDGLSKFAE